VYREFCPQPLPALTIPVHVHELFKLVMNGVPLSPKHESVPEKPAQNRIELLDEAEHDDESPCTLIVPCNKLSDIDELDVAVVPQPAITPRSSRLGSEVSDVRQQRPTLLV
jgi:hypothetical protein